MSTIHSKDIPNYITAESPQGLRRAMFKKNAEHGSQHQYFDIQQFKDKRGKAKWIAWFYVELKDLEELDGDS